MSNEPEQLRRGKAFHKLIQEEWLSEAGGVIRPESAIIKPNGRRGRIDILTDPDEADVAVVEIKASDWDKMTSKAVRRNIRRQLNQIWNYIHSQLALDKTVSTGIIFPKRPQSKERLELIEKMFYDDGVPVVWHNEGI